MADQTDTTATETSTTTDPDAAGAATNDTATTGVAPADDAGESADATVLGSATTDSGAGTEEGKDGQSVPTPTPVPDDAGVPEAYDLKLVTTAEDGTETPVEMDTALVEAATPVFKEAGLSNAQANKVVSLMPQVQDRLLAQMNANFEATRADWAKQAQADPEIGGKNWTETQQLAAKALDHFAGRSEKDEQGAEKNAFRKLLNDSGLGNNPDMIRAWRKVGEAFSEDGTFTRNTVNTETPKSREERNYPNDQPKQS